jgi:hypothetical protein
MAQANSSKCDVLLIGGQIASGKSTAARTASEMGGAGLLRVRDALEQILGIPNADRRRLQIEGASLDTRTGGRWLVDYMSEHCPSGSRWVVDSARTRRQVEPILESRIGTRLIYLRATEQTRRVRYALGSEEDAVKRSTSFDEAMSHHTEIDAMTIAEMSDFIVETDDLNVEEITSVILKWCQW